MTVYFWKFSSIDFSSSRETPFSFATSPPLKHESAAVLLSHYSHKQGGTREGCWCTTSILKCPPSNNAYCTVCSTVECWGYCINNKEAVMFVEVVVILQQRFQSRHQVDYRTIGICLWTPNIDRIFVSMLWEVIWRLPGLVSLWWLSAGAERLRLVTVNTVQELGTLLSNILRWYTYGTIFSHADSLKKSKG